MRLKKLDKIPVKRAITFWFVFMFVICGTFLFADEGEQQEISWLALGPAKVGSIEKNLLKGDHAILKFDHLPLTNMLPKEGEIVRWDKNTSLRWRVLRDLNFFSASTEILYLTTYLETDRFLQAKLVIKKDKNGPPLSAFLDGKSIGTTKSDDKISLNLDLLNNKHVLVLKILLPAGKEINLKTFLQTGEDFRGDRVRLSLSPTRRVSEEDILNTVSVRGISLSPNGKLAAVFLSQTQQETGAGKSWVEILDTGNGATVFTTADFGKISGLRWLKDSLSFSFTRSEKGKTSLYMYHLGSNRTECILEKVEDFSTYWWASDNSFLVYSRVHRQKRDGGYKHIKEISDRSKYSGASTSMYIYFPAGKVTHKITGAKEDFYDAMISPDCKKALLIKDEPDNKNRPYRKSIIHLFDVAALKNEFLLESNWASPQSWSPDSEKILFLGGPSSFAGIGQNLKEGRIPNDYDQQAFICDLSNIDNAGPITKDFDPTIDSASWSSSSDNIYFKVTEKSSGYIYRYSISKKSYKRLNTKVDVVANVGFAGKRNIAVYWGSSAGTPHKLYKLNLSSGRSTLLKDFNKASYRHVKIGRVEPWNFKSKEGKTIIGRLHYPVDFDKNKKYPCIVYYYGGTSPVDRSFGGRYPFNWYTAQGYIVYVLQPSGAVGFGQDFSSIHVNDWGKKTSEEILTGVSELLKAHPYIDPNALGAMGASYGGFMTQYLATCTDVFAAYISHAGISALSSYWGVGDWGYTYSGVATADSFPWNRKDIYVGHSPLFRADRITRPLLLLHGDADNNVPPGESYQMFAALKLLNKEVALVTFDNLSHLILEYNKRLQWMHTIIAWFDKYLKKQPQYWGHLYPSK